MLFNINMFNNIYNVFCILFKCHTEMQTFIGALIGIILGLLLYKYKNKIKIASI